MTYFVTRRCNAKCPYCFYLQRDADDITSESELAQRELSLAEIRKISGSLGSLLWLAFSGGEVFMRRDIVEISRVFYDNNKPVYMLYPTNGLTPEIIYRAMREILEICRNSVVIVKLSIDDIHERNDILRNTPGHFARTLRTYELLSRLKPKYDNFELGVNTVFCALNQDNMQNIIDFVSELEYVGAHTISLIRGDLKYPHYKNVDLNKYRYYTEVLAKRLRQAKSPRYGFAGGRIKLAQDILQRRLIHQTQSEQRRIIPCFAGRANVVLTENGGVYACESFSHEFGNVRDHDYNINAVMETDTAKSALEKIGNACCYCSHECYFITNIMLNPNLYPGVVKEYLQLRTAMADGM